MCMWFWYYLQIIICYFFRILNLVIFEVGILSKGIDSGTLCAQLLLQFYADPFETLRVFVVVWRCACGFDIIFIF